jgi:hypothetical protein
VGAPLRGAAATFRLARFVIMTPPDGWRRRACRGVPSSGVAANSANRRREPDRPLLHQTVRAHLKTFLAEMEQRGDGAGLPSFVIAEFERYLACGDGGLTPSGAFAAHPRQRLCSRPLQPVRRRAAGRLLLRLAFRRTPARDERLIVLSCAAGRSPLLSRSVRLIAMKEEEGQATELRLSVLPA